MTDFLTDNAVAVTLTVNGAVHALQVEPRELLVSVLRDRLSLTGTHIGCETTSCGACTVLLDGRSVKSCTVLAVQAQGQAITTIEGLAGPDRLHPVQEAFRRCHGLQCGFCTPGFLVTVTAGLRATPDPELEQAREMVGGNLCRCTGYHNIVQAVLSAARAMQGDGS